MANTRVSLLWQLKLNPIKNPGKAIHMHNLQEGCLTHIQPRHAAGSNLRVASIGSGGDTLHEPLAFSEISIH